MRCPYLSIVNVVLLCTWKKILEKNENYKYITRKKVLLWINFSKIHNRYDWRKKIVSNIRRNLYQLRLLNYCLVWSTLSRQAHTLSGPHCLIRSTLSRQVYTVSPDLHCPVRSTLSRQVHTVPSGPQSRVATNSYEVAMNSYEVTTNSYEVATNSYEVATNSYEVATDSHRTETNSHQIIAITTPY